MALPQRLLELFFLFICLSNLSRVAFSQQQQPNWATVDQILQKGIATKVFPGCVAAVADKNGILYMKAFGNFTYGVPPPATPFVNPSMTVDTVFDVASLTKVMATTTAMMILYQQGHLDLDMPLTDPSLIGPQFGQNGKGLITSRHLLMHNAGFPADPEPNYWAKAFGCPETSKLHPDMNYSCRQKIWDSLMVQTLQYPINTQSIYSDLSMITAMFVTGKIVRTHGYVSESSLDSGCAASLPKDSPLIDQCYYEAFVRLYVIGKVGMVNSGFNPSPALWPRIAPTWNDTEYRHLVIQGTVSDGNAYALGGIAGHAGLFSDIRDAMKLSRRLLFASETDSLINATTVKYWTKAENLTQSSRALGWDTNDYQMNTYRGCANLSPQTFTHTGFTGTQICCDPVNEIVAILFTNRVYPNMFENMKTVQAVRQAFSNAVLDIVVSSRGSTQMRNS